MRAFPFDRQFMEFLIESYWEVDTLQIIFAEQDKINYLLPTDMPDIVGWSWIQNGYRAMTQDYPYNGGQYHRLIIRTLLERQPDYYLTKIVSGSMLLVYMCVWVFSLAVDEADRMMGTLSSFLGLVTFLFVASGDTPKVPYQTRLDVFMTFSLSDTLALWHADDLSWGAVLLVSQPARCSSCGCVCPPPLPLQHLRRRDAVHPWWSVLLA
jgi:hypothetical protein